MKIKIVLSVTLIVISLLARSQQLPGSNPVLKVLSFNIYHGATMKGDFDLHVIAKVIEDADPDLVALQEVDFRTRRARDYDLATELGRMVKMAPLFGRAMYYDGGEYGEAVLSKYTFIESRNIPLPYTPGNEPRAALEITAVIAPGDTISFIGTHLDHLRDETDRIAQAVRINEIFSANRYPTILAGDLNAEPGSLPINILETIWDSSYDTGSPEPTFPSDNPRKKIDYVMHFPKGRWRVLDSSVLCDSVASDHCAYLVTLELIR